MGYSFIKLSREDQVGKITLNRPEAHNAINPELLADLTQAIGELRDSPDIKAVVVTGEGEAFCSGTDLKFLQKAMAHDMSQVFEFGQRFAKMVEDLDEFPVPTIAMVNGFTFAGGIELMLSFDMIIAAEDAQIGDQHMNRGTIGGPVMWQLPHRIGLQKAMEVVLTGKWLSGKEAERYGIVLRAVPRERLEAEVADILAQLRNKSLPSVMTSLTEAVRYVTVEWGQHQAPQAGLKQGVAHFVDERETRPKQ
jgi:enoyl-CoA hydratase